MDVPVVDDHPRKIRVSEVRPDATLEASEGWVDMAVQWIVTRHSVGSERTVFGITTMPPGGRHEIHRHPHAEEVEYLVQGEALARVGDVDVRMRAGDVIFVRADESHGLWNTSKTEPAVVVWCYGGAASLEEAGYVHEPEANWRETLPATENPTAADNATPADNATAADKPTPAENPTAGDDS